MHLFIDYTLYTSPTFCPSSISPTPTHMPLDSRQTEVGKRYKSFQPTSREPLLCNSKINSSLEYLLRYGLFSNNWSHCTFSLLVAKKVATYGPEVMSGREKYWGNQLVVRQFLLGLANFSPQMSILLWLVQTQSEYNYSPGSVTNTQSYGVELERTRY